MRWFLSRVDMLARTFAAAVLGGGASQFMAFVQQYRQRLGGHLAESQFNIRQTMEGHVYRGLDLERQRSLLSPLETRVNDLNDTNTVLATARPWELPWSFLRTADWDIAAGTFADFQPAMPLDVVSLVYAALGLLVGWLLYGVLKMPFRRSRSTVPD